MSGEFLSLDEFKELAVEYLSDSVGDSFEKIGKVYDFLRERVKGYWSESLEGVSEEYESLVAGTILRKARYDGWNASTSSFAKELKGIVEGIARVNEDYVFMVFEDANGMMDSCSGTAESLAISSPGVLEEHGLEGYNKMLSGVCRLGEIECWPASFLAESSLDILNFGKEGCYELVVDSACRVADEDWLISTTLVKYSAEILEAGGLEGYEEVVDRLSRLAGKYSRVSEKLVEASVKIMKDYGLSGYKFVCDCVEQVIGESEDYAVDLADRSFDLLKGFNTREENSADLFLIKSIRNQYDVNVIGDIISRNTEVKKAYDRVCGEFY